MANNDKGNRIIFNRKLVRYSLTLIYLIIIVVVFLPKIITKDEISTIIRELNLILFSLAVVAQIFSYFGSGFMLKSLLNNGKTSISIFRGALITMAAASFGLVAGGLVSTALATYYLVPKSNKDEGDAELAVIMPPLFNTVTLVIISFIGSFYLVLNHDLSESQIVLYISILIIIIIVIAAILYGLFHKNKINYLITRISNLVNRNKQVKIDSLKLASRLDLFYDRLNLLISDKWGKPVLGSLMNIVFDIITLYIVFLAAGFRIHPIILIAGYGITFLVSRSAFFIPGGAGVIEGGMVGIYASLGLPMNTCVVAVLGYRLLSFWMPSLFGFIAFFILKKQRTINDNYGK